MCTTSPTLDVAAAEVASKLERSLGFIERVGAVEQDAVKESAADKVTNGRRSGGVFDMFVGRFRRLVGSRASTRRPRPHGRQQTELQGTLKVLTRP